MDLEFDYLSAGLKEVDLDLLSSITSSLFTVERSAVSSSASRASDSALRASAVVLFSARSAMSESLARVMIPLGLGILSFMYPVMGYGLEDCKRLPP